MTSAGVIKLSQPYIPLIQKPMCCAVTCLQMILYRNGFGLYDQEDLAVEFGVKISPKDAAAFRGDMSIMTSANFDEGIPTIESQELINEFFYRLGVPLIATAYRFSDIEDVEDFIINGLQANNDLWIEYHAHEIHRNDATEGQYIHDGLIESYDTGSKSAVILDPVPEHRQRLDVGLGKIEASISREFGRETGIVIVSAKEQAQ